MLGEPLHLPAASLTRILCPEYLCHVYVRNDGLAGVVVADTEYPQRVCFTLLDKVSVPAGSSSGGDGLRRGCSRELLQISCWLWDKEMTFLLISWGTSEPSSAGSDQPKGFQAVQWLCPLGLNPGSAASPGIGLTNAPSSLPGAPGIAKNQ